MGNDEPLILGLAGQAATGKTSTADALAPPGRDAAGIKGIYWNHLFFAMPLYRMATARQKIQGFNAFSRQCYEIHDVLLDVFARELDYGVFIDLVWEIASCPITEDGIKPREFLQQVGTDLCRKLEPDCWVKWMRRQIRKEHQIYLAEYEDDFELQHGIVVSDIRFRNEAALVRESARGTLLRLTARPEVIAARIESRDGIAFRPEQAKHLSEQSLQDVPEEWWDQTIDTSDMTLTEQVNLIKEIAYKHA